MSAEREVRIKHDEVVKGRQEEDEVSRKHNELHNPENDHHNRLAGLLRKVQGQVPRILQDILVKGNNITLKFNPRVVHQGQGNRSWGRVGCPHPQGVEVGKLFFWLKKTFSWVAFEYL